MEDCNPARKNGPTPPAFLEKLYDIMENKSLHAFIAWQPDGRSFLIKDVEALSQSVLPFYFKHNNIQSFVRQLNMYNFSKTRHDSNYREFRQPLFQRGRRDLLSIIRRKSQVSSERSGAAKRKYEAESIDYEAKYSLALHNHVAPSANASCWANDDDGAEDTCSSSSDASDFQSERNRELESIKSSMSNIESQMWSVSERYNALSASYTNLHERYDSFQSLYGFDERSHYCPPNKGPLPENFPSKVQGAKQPSEIIRVISIDPCAIPKCEPVFKGSNELTSPRPVPRKDSTITQLLYPSTTDKHQHLGKSIDPRDSDAHRGARRKVECAEAGDGLDTMALAASLRDKEVFLRSSLADLIDAASSSQSA